MTAFLAKIRDFGMAAIRILYPGLFILTFFCIFSCSSFAVDTASGTINSASLSYLTGVVNKLPVNTDYVIYKDGDYSSQLVYGQLELGSSSISGSDLTYCTYDTRGISYGTGYYYPTITSGNLSSFDLSLRSTSIIYSNLGSYASVGTKSSTDPLQYILWSLVFIILLFVVFKFIRNRRSYIKL